MQASSVSCFVFMAVAATLFGQDGRVSGAAAIGRPPVVHSSAHPGFVSDALEVVPLTTAQALARADRVLYVRATGNEVKRGIGNNIFTYSKFSLIQAIKGTAASEVTLRLLGGRIGNDVIVGPLNVEFAVGDRFVLFLGKDNAEGYPMLIPQAIYAVKSLDGVDVVDPSPTGIALYHARDQRAYSGPAAHPPVEDFIYSLAKAR